MKFITVNGLSRSGNHAIIRWMAGQYEDSGYEVFFHNNAIKNFMEYLNLRGGGGMRGIAANPKFIDILMHITRNDKKVFMISFEDLMIDDRLGKITEFADHNVVILRDPYNLFASRIQGLLPPRGKKGNANITDLREEEINRYMSQYKEFVGDTSCLSYKICINYNYWVVDEDYRKKISESLGTKFTDSNYQQRACSSFGPKSPIELPSEKPEDFLERYKACWEDPMFNRIKESEEFAAISKKVFGIEVNGGGKVKKR